MCMETRQEPFQALTAETRYAALMLTIETGYATLMYALAEHLFYA